MRPFYDAAQTLGQLEQTIQAALRIAPRAVDHQLHIRPQLGCAVEPVDVGNQAHGIGELVLMEGDQSAACADIDLGDMGGDRLRLDLDQADQILGRLRQFAEAVDHFGGKAFDLGLSLGLVEAAV